MSVEPNEEKFWHLLNKATNSDCAYYTIYNDMPNTIVFNHDIIDRKVSGIGRDELAKIANSCCFNISFHRRYKWDYDNHIWVTPYLDDELVREDEIYFHISKSKNLCKTGIRLRSRVKDNEFDVYNDRIYLGCYYPNYKFVTLSDACYEILNECRNEHERANMYVYRVRLPKSVRVYQDPTSHKGSYVIQSIPKEWIELVPKKEIEFF